MAYINYKGTAFTARKSFEIPAMSAAAKCQVEVLIGSDQLPFHVIDIGTIHYLHPSGSRIVAGEVPVSQMPGTRFMKVGDGLEHHLHVCFHAGGLYDF